MDTIKFLMRMAIIISVPLIVAMATYVFLRKAFFSPVDESNKTKIIIEIAPGRTFGQICREMRNKGILRYDWSLSALARIKKIDTRISAGEYELSPAMTPLQILAKLMSGDIIKRQITVKEGQSIWELGALLEKAGIISAQEFNPVLTEPDLLNRAGITASSFEGYLFPETYFFSRPITAQHVIWAMLEEGEKRWPSTYSTRAEELRMTRHEILTLASIIEKESGNPVEQTVISSVFHNRLNQGMKLQADPTVVYGIPHFSGSLTKEDLQNPNNPYNTYTHFGLPPGPICNPGANAIKAALYPQASNYLYFVADGAGTHMFAATLQEHNENVARYLRTRSAMAND